jgi:hypothetical protein
MARYNTSPQTLSITGETELQYAFTGGIISMTGTPGYTVTMVNPVFFPGSRQTFYNATDGFLTLASASGNITGNGVALGNSVQIPTNSTYTMTSDGANYVLTSALAGTTEFRLPVHFEDLLEANGKVELNPNNNNVEISPTGSGIVDISPASHVQMQGTGQVTINPSQAVSITSAGSSVTIGTAGLDTFINGDLNLSAPGQTITLSPSGAAGNVVINPGGDTSIGAGGTVTITSTTGGTISNMSIGATNPGTGAFTSLAASGTIQANATTASTSTTSGALVATGGIGVGGSVYAGGLNGPLGGGTASTIAATTITASGAVSLTQNVAATNTTSGTLRVTGGIGVTGSIYAGGIQSTPIGNTSASSGAFTSLNANSTVDITGTTEATDTTGDTGILRVEGGASIAKRVYSGGGFQGAVGNISRSTGLFTTLGTNSTTTLGGNTSVSGSSTFSVGTGAATFGGSVQFNGGSVAATSAFTPSNAYDLMTKTYTERQYGKTWVIQSANTTAASGDRLMVNTTSSARTITLPASPNLGDTVTFVDYGGTFNSRALTVARNNQRIMGIADNMTVSTQGAGFTLVFSGNSTYGWRMMNGI